MQGTLNIRQLLHQSLYILRYPANPRTLLLHYLNVLHTLLVISSSMPIPTRALKNGPVVFQASVKNNNRLAKIQISMQVAQQVLYELLMEVEFS